MLIRNGGELCGLSFDESAEDAVVSAAHGSPYLATLLGHHAGFVRSTACVREVGVPMCSLRSQSAAQGFHGRFSGRARGQLKQYAGSEKSSLLGVVAGVSLLSNGSFRIEDLLGFHARFRQPPAIRSDNC